MSRLDENELYMASGEPVVCRARKCVADEAHAAGRGESEHELTRISPLVALFEFAERGEVPECESCQRRPQAEAALALDVAEGLTTRPGDDALDDPSSTTARVLAG